MPERTEVSGDRVSGWWSPPWALALRWTLWTRQTEDVIDLTVIIFQWHKCLAYHKAKQREEGYIMIFHRYFGNFSSSPEINLNCQKQLPRCARAGSFSWSHSKPHWWPRDPSGGFILCDLILELHPMPPHVAASPPECHRDAQLQSNCEQIHSTLVVHFWPKSQTFPKKVNSFH